MSDQPIYIIGGTVQAGDGIYIARKADEELLDLCRKGVFAYILTARQVGKSSLMVQTSEYLEAEGIRTVIIDLTQIGVNVTAKEWQFGILSNIEEQLGLETDVLEWWNANGHLGFSQRFVVFFQDVVLKEVQESVVFFFDEIDTTFNLNFADDFYATVRSFYDARGRNHAFERISFVLIGVARPTDLISNPQRTPFNIGEQITLTDFTLAEAAPLSRGLDSDPEHANRLLAWIIDWTNGHPYLTQRFCRLVVDHPKEIHSKKDFDELVEEHFLGENVKSDHNLQFVHRMMTEGASNTSELLEIYQSIRDEKKAIKDERHSQILAHLKLSGIVRSEAGLLKVRNKIYDHVFDKLWIRENWPDLWIKRFFANNALTISVVFLGLIAVAIFQFINFRQAQRIANQQSQIAQQQTQFANEQAVLNRELILAKSASDSLLGEVQNSNRLLGITNQDLEQQRNVSEDLRKETERQNLELTQINEALIIANNEKDLLADSLIIQYERVDALLTESQVSREQNITVVLAQAGLKQVRLGNEQLGALLANQAYSFNERIGDLYREEVYEALRVSLNAIDGAGVAGGPRIYTQHDGWIRNLTYSTDGLKMASASENGIIGLWAVSDTLIRPRFIKGHSDVVRSVVFTSDSQSLISGGDDGLIKIWHRLEITPPNYSTLTTPDGASVWTIALHPSNKIIATAGSDNRIHIWDIEELTLLHSFEIPSSTTTYALSFSSDEETLISAHNNGMFYIWEWESSNNNPLYAKNAEQSHLNSVIFSPSNPDLFVTGGDSTKVNVWLLERGDSMNVQLLQSLRGHEGPINSLAFNQSGTILASGSSDKSVQVWYLDQLVSGVSQETVSLTLQDHTGWVLTTSFSPDGFFLSSGGADRSIRTWQIKPSVLSQEICKIVQRGLNESDWALYVGVDLNYDTYRSGCQSPKSNGKIVNH